MASTYSETFFVLRTKELWTAYTVPVGRRAVLRCVASTNSVASPGVVYVKVNNATCLITAFQGINETKVWDVRLVAYAGQVIQAYHTANGIESVISGYLFADPALSRDAPGNVSESADPVPGRELGQGTLELAP